MNTKRIISLLLVIVMVLTATLTACTTAEQENETIESSKDETNENATDSGESEQENDTSSSSETDEAGNTDSSETVTDEKVTETTTKEEDTEEDTEKDTSEEITDVTIGETIEAEYAASFSVAKIFSDDMVVQRNEHIRVWGFAPESENGKKVSGTFKGMFAEALIENGEWCITFTARLEADVNGAEMKIYTDTKEIVFSGVLVGDVYLVMGQSNAAYTVNNHLLYNDPATQGGSKSDIDPNSIIRLNFLNSSGGTYSKAGTDYVYPDLTNTKFWTKTTEANTLPFSAIGYYFALEMVEKSNNTVPVGLIEAARGGAPMGSFLPNDLAEKYDTDYYNAAEGKYLTFRSSEHMGRYFYNCYLSPIQNYSIAGVVWYQGESNNGQQYSPSYGAEFGDFIERLRSTHNILNKDFPVFAVEIPTIYKQPANYSGSETWQYMEVGMIRAYMGLLPSTINNCYVSASSDLWNNRTFWNNLHPNCKYEQAERLADIAAIVIFGEGAMEKANGPVFKSATISADKKTVVITFTNVGDGLTTIDGEAVKGIVGLINRDFVYTTVNPISTTITAKDQITVVFDQEVKAAAYNYDTQDYFGETLNLCNSAKLPALAFITPYTERDITGYTPDKFVLSNNSSLKLKGSSIDTLNVDGASYFETAGGVAGKLNSIGNTIYIPQGTGTVNLHGWIGFGYQILRFGYSVDGSEAKFNADPLNAEQNVINAGGQYAKRFGVNIFAGDLTPGKHTLTLLVLIDLNGGTAVKLLEFNAVVTEKDPEPEGLDLPRVNTAPEFRAWAHDEIKAGGVQLYYANVNTKLAADNNRITITEGCASFSYAGWLGFTTTIDNVGYAINGSDPTFTDGLGNPGQAVINAGGANAKRYTVVFTTRNLPVGEYVIDILVRINTENGGQAVYIINSFTLIVAEAK